MAEEKIIKHTGDAARALLKGHVSWNEKLKEFFFEIFIIVIAVSITLWFHNWNDHLHEKHGDAAGQAVFGPAHFRGAADEAAEAGVGGWYQGFGPTPISDSLPG